MVNKSCIWIGWGCDLQYIYLWRLFLLPFQCDQRDWRIPGRGETIWNHQPYGKILPESKCWNSRDHAHGLGKGVDWIMTGYNLIDVHYENGLAVITASNYSITIARRDSEKLNYLCPIDLISASLGSWITLTISAVAEFKKINLVGIDVRVFRKNSETEKDKSIFYIEIKLVGELSQREKVMLFNSARKCDVSKILAGEVGFEYLLKDDTNP